MNPELTHILGREQLHPVCPVAWSNRRGVENMIGDSVQISQGLELIAQFRWGGLYGILDA